MSGPEPDDSGDVNDDTDADGGDADEGADSWASLSPARAAVAERLATYDSLLEVGIGRRPGVAAALAAEGVRVTAVDVHEFPVPHSVEFVQTDVVELAAELSAGAASEPSSDGESEGVPTHYRVEAIYALNLPPELHRPTATVAEAVDAAFLFTTLGGDPAAIPTRAETLDRETLYVARE